MIAYDIEALDEFIKNLQSENSAVNRKEVTQLSHIDSTKFMN